MTKDLGTLTPAQADLVIQNSETPVYDLAPTAKPITVQYGQRYVVKSVYWIKGEQVAEILYTDTNGGEYRCEALGMSIGEVKQAVVDDLQRRARELGEPEQPVIIGSKPEAECEQLRRERNGANDRYLLSKKFTAMHWNANANATGVRRSILRLGLRWR